MQNKWELLEEILQPTEKFMTILKIQNQVSKAYFRCQSYSLHGRKETKYLFNYIPSNILQQLIEGNAVCMIRTAQEKVLKIRNSNIMNQILAEVTLIIFLHFLYKKCQNPIFI